MTNGHIYFVKLLHHLPKSVIMDSNGASKSALSNIFWELNIVMGKVDDNKKLKLTSMLDSAFQLFTDKGLAKTSISDIVESSGVAKGTFYLYFKDKFDIRNKLVVYQSTKVLRRAYEATNEQEANLPLLEDKVVFFVGHVLDQLAARPDLINLISKNLSWGMLKQEAMRPLTETDDFDLMKLFKLTAKDSGIPEDHLEIMLYMIVEMAGATCYSAILYQEPCTLEQLKPHLFETVRSIVRQFVPDASASMESAEAPAPENSDTPEATASAADAPNESEAAFS